MFFKKLKLAVYLIIGVFLTLGVSISLQSVAAAVLSTPYRGITLGATDYTITGLENLIYGVVSDASVGSFILLQKPGSTDKFRVDYNGNITAAGNITTAGNITAAGQDVCRENGVNCLVAACGSGQFVTAVGASLTCATPVVGGNGTVTSITAGAGLSGGTITTTGTISLNTANSNTWTANQAFSSLNTSGASYLNMATNVIKAQGTASEVAVNYAGTAKGFTVYNNISPLFRVDSAGDVSVAQKLTVSGNVGIGTLGYPLMSKLSVEGDVSAGNMVEGNLLARDNTGGVVSKIAGRDSENSYINNGGNVGIGTNAPAYKLDVAGDINFTGVLRQNGVLAEEWASSGSNISNNNTGNVGIGTAAPGSKLAISGGVTIGTIYSTRVVPDGGLIIVGNVGIGTNNPVYKLDVKGPLSVMGYSPADPVAVFSNGYVGIGITSPAYKLDVSGGDINVSGVYRQGGAAGVSPVACGAGTTPSGVTISGGIVTSAGACTAIGGGGSQWTTSGSNIYNNNQTGRVLIGATILNRDSPFQVTAYETQNVADFRSSLTGMNGFIRISTADGLDAVFGVESSGNVYLNSNNPLKQFHIPLTTVIDGNVGIGTANPGQRLSVVGNIYGTGGINIGTTESYGAGTFSGGVSFTNTPSYGVASVGSIRGTNWQGNGFMFSNYSSGSTFFSMVYNGDKAYFGSLISGASSPTAFGSWNAAGLAIGSFTNTNKLDVSGAAAVGSYAGTAAPANGLIVSGKVGIGTAAPTAALDILATSGAQLALRNTTASSFVSFLNTAGTNSFYFYNFGNTYTTSGRYIQSSTLHDASGAGGLSLSAYNAAGTIKFWTAGDNERMRITSTGNVGIGTANPLGKLDVNGTIYQRGSSLHADYVFEPDYKLESIEDHAIFMWENGHLKALPKAQKDENGQDIVEYGAQSKGILEELEKAHVYIQQLNDRIKVLEAKMKK